MRLSEIMGSAGLSLFPQVGLVIFLVVFAGIITRVFLRRNHAGFRREALIVLDDETKGADRADQP